MQTVNPVQIQLLGDFAVIDGGHSRPLPRSRKTRGLLAYLALEDRPHRREDLCNLLWELPSDPRAALRWSLSKLRPLFGAASDDVLVADRESVRIDRTRVGIDVIEIREAMTRGAPDEAALLDFDARLAKGYPGGLEDAGGVDFHLWLNAEREALRSTTWLKSRI